MDACPVSCIHWVSREDLPALEFVVRYKARHAPALLPHTPPCTARRPVLGSRSVCSLGFLARVLDCSSRPRVWPLRRRLRSLADVWAVRPPLRLQVKRTNVAAMMSAQGGAIDDVWAATTKYLKDRRRK